MVEEVDVGDGRELGDGEEGGCGAVVEGGGLFEVPACV